MNINADLPEVVHIVSGFVPVDMSSAANTGDWVSLKNYSRVDIVLYKDAGTAGDDPTITVEQAQDVSGTGAKNLTAVDRVYYAQQTALTSDDTYTKATQTAAATYTDATSAEDQAIWVIPIEADELDTANSFDCIRASVADVGTNAQLGCMFYVLRGPRYGKAAMPTAIAD